jgi:hypothetical protein
MNPQMNDARVANKNFLFDVRVRASRRLLALLEYQSLHLEEEHAPE